MYGEFIFKFDSLFNSAIRKDIAQGIIPMLLGEPGIGKSSFVEAVGNDMHTKVFTLNCNQLADKADLTGARLVPDGSNNYKQVFYPHQVVADAIAYAEANPRETPILFLDELNRTTSDVTSACLNLATARTIGSFKLPDNLKIACAGNDKGNVTSLDEASITRFQLYHIKPDCQTFLGLDPELNIFIRNVLTSHPDCIFCKKAKLSATGNDTDEDEDAEVDLDELLEETEVAQLTTPRTISKLSDWLNSCTNQELLEMISLTQTCDGVEKSFLQGKIEGQVGQTTFAALLLQEIANGIVNTNNQANVTTIPKPNCYDAFKACSSVSDLNDFVNSMTDADKSGCLLYALFEKENNEVYIQALAPSVQKFEGQDMKTLMGLYSNDKLDNENLHCLLGSTSSIATTLNMVMG